MLTRAQEVQRRFVEERGLHAASSPQQRLQPDQAACADATMEDSEAAQAANIRVDDEMLWRILAQRDMCASDYELLRLLVKHCWSTGQPLSPWALNINFGRLSPTQVICLCLDLQLCGPGFRFRIQDLQSSPAAWQLSDAWPPNLTSRKECVHSEAVSSLCCWPVCRGQIMTPFKT